MHVAFRAERVFCDELAAALASPERMHETLARWWDKRELRLDQALVPRPRDLLHPSPPKVRLAALHAVQHLAPRVSALQQLNAPPSVVAVQRRLLEQAIGELDPAAPRAHTPVPEVAEPWVFVDRMLAAAHAGMPSLSLRDYTGGPPVWTTLPRTFPDARAESSGSISYALAGDLPGPRLDHRLARQVRRLQGDAALISFVWLTNDSAGDWDPLRI